MKPRCSFLLLLPVVVTTTALANISLDFSSLGSARIDFQATNDSIVFSPDVTGFDFKISNSTVSGLDGLQGNIQGTFMMGSPVSPAPGLQQASVTGAGTLSIYDGVSSYFTAKVWWYDASTFGTIGGLNTQGLSNISNFSYSGSNPDLIALAQSTAGTDVVSFQFAAPESISLLENGTGVTATTYSGSLSTVPESSAFALVAGGIALAGGLILRRRAIV